MTRVLIIGARKQHILQLQEEYKNRLLIESVTDQTKHSKRKSNCANYDHIISLKHFTNHSVERSYNYLDSYVALRGGVSSIRRFLKEQVSA